LDGRGGEHAPDIATSAKIQGLSGAQIEKIVRDGIPAAGMPSFGPTLGAGQIAQVLQYLRVLQGQGKISAPGDSTRGRQLFFGRANCANCHMVAGQGGFMGADLSAYGVNHSETEIRGAIVTPANKATVSVTTRQGQNHYGLIRNEDNFSLQIQTVDGKFYFFDKQDLARVEHPAKPLMPETYGSQLSKGELDDLIGFLMKAPATAVSAQGSN
jgi:putative heme-binding domain-containing protein